jgi:UDP-N-acetylmuramoyl-tripeptide--D-alanyl-D-alanine ligase
MSRFSRHKKLQKIRSYVRDKWIRSLPILVKLWRPLFRRTTFVGVTGSHGKTTATFLLAAMVLRRGPTYFRSDYNGPRDIRKNVMKALPWRHRFFVQEVSGNYPGAITRCNEVLRPTVGIVTAVGADHRKSFGGSVEAIAAEKENLVRALPPPGLAVLNADDPLVAAMAGNCVCRVVRFGRADNSDLRLIKAKSVWPERLTLEVEYRGEIFEVKTQLVGVHWSVSVMAAMLAALEMGVPKDDCLAALATRAPYYNRMSVHPAPNGGWYVLDAFKSSFVSIAPSLEFLANAIAPRRTVLFGTISEYPGSSRPHYYRAARMALAVADRVIFTGPNADRVRRLAAEEFAGRLFYFDRPADAISMLENDAIPDEIIYVKATGHADKLGPMLAPRRRLPRQSPSAVSPNGDTPKERLP